MLMVSPLAALNTGGGRRTGRRSGAPVAVWSQHLRVAIKVGMAIAFHRGGVFAMGPFGRGRSEWGTTSVASVGCGGRQ